MTKYRESLPVSADCPELRLSTAVYVCCGWGGGGGGGHIFFFGFSRAFSF
eukprot:COSAG05_NODE_1171_length_5626_cov_7.557626_9_plen_49_part_01